jgi:signal transduction histidine kinase
MPEQLLNPPHADVTPSTKSGGVVARYAHVWLGLMLLALHAATAWGIDAPWSSALLLVHFGMFLLWQPLWQSGGRLRPSHGLLIVLMSALLVIVSSWWLICLWLAALTALIGGSVPSITGPRQRTVSLLAAVYLMALLLIWVVPQLAGQVPAGPVLPNLVRYGLPLIALAILFVRPAPQRAAAPTIVFDLFYSLMLFLLVAALVLGSLVIVKTSQGQYIVALAETLIVIAVALAGLSWLMSPTAGFAGFDQLLSRYLLSVGLPFEQWVQRLADIAERESEPRQFLDAALEHVLALPWVIGLRWESPRGSGQHGRLNERYADFVFDDLNLRIHTRWALSPAMLLHVKLLAQMVGHFYAAKLREQLQRKNAYTQAIHETGSRLTHDVKNLLQSMQALCAASQDAAPDQSADLLALMQRQLPQITQRLNTTLDKLRTPLANDANNMRVAQWWPALQQRYAHRPVKMTLTGTLGDALVPGEMFDSLAENLIENALRKGADVKVEVAFDPARTTLSVSDSGSAVPAAVAADLFSAPVASQFGLGVGLYHAAKYAAQHGYQLTLAGNETGAVRFMLSAASK